MKKKEETPQEEPKIESIYNIDDYNFIMNIRKRGGITTTEEPKIFEIYKKYIDNKQVNVPKNGGCISCAGSFLKMWNTLHQWIYKNAELFIKN